MSTLVSDDAPKELQKSVARIGGSNMYGKPLWRVVLAQHRRMICGGIFHEFDQFSDQFNFDKGKADYTPLKATRVEHDAHREVPMYAVEGWILERWLPPGTWGTREAWEGMKAEDGVTPILGPYPDQGDYWMLGGPWERVPDLGDLEQAIQIYELGRSKAPANFEAAMNLYIKREQDRKVEEYERFVEELEKYQKSEIEPLMKSTSLAAQGVRNAVQKKLGLKSHLGVQ
jgi:hypothetical protein